MHNKKSILTTALFCGILFLGGLFSIITPDKDLSYSERRHLTQRPSFSLKRIANGKYFGDLEGYSVDQFILREPFRTVKALSSLYLFRRQDFHGIYLADGMAVSMEYPLKDEKVEGFIRKVNTIKSNLLNPGQNVFYAVIPDKNYYLAGSSGHLSINYDRMLGMLNAGLTDIRYIDLFPFLTAQDFYATDSHWRQEKLECVTGALAEGLGLDKNPFPQEYQAKSYSPFYGVYYGQSALPLLPDSIIYLETLETENAIVTHIEDKDPSVYNTGLLGGIDSYGVFLSGATSVCTITNPLNPDGRELIIFRDSYASSLAPLLLSAYSKITLIDIRYINASLLPQYIDFSNQDVLFLYSASLINQSNILRA